MAAYPTDLPAPLLASYGVTRQPNVLRTEMESGIARQRRRSLATPHKINASFQFSAAHMLAFNTFFDTTLHGGVDWFSMVLDIGDGSQTYNQVRFIAEDMSIKKLSHNAYTVDTQLELIDA